MNWGAFWLALVIVFGCVGLGVCLGWLEDYIGAWSYAIPLFIILILAAVGAGLTVSTLDLTVAP